MARNKRYTEVHYTTESILRRMQDVPEGNRSRADNGNGGSFTTTDWDTTLKYLERGYDKVTGEVSRFEEKLSIQVANQRPGLDSIRYGEEGDWVDIDRYLNKEYDECFVELTEGNPRPIRSLNMIVNLTANCSIRADALYMRGAAIAFLCDYFRRIGINVDLWASDTATGCPDNGGRADIVNLFKIDTNEGYSLNQLASILALPDFFRRVGFALSELLTGQATCGSYGSAADIVVNGKVWENAEPQVLEILGGEEAVKNALYFGVPDNDWADFDWTVKEVCRIIDEFNTKHGVDERR